MTFNIVGKIGRLSLISAAIAGVSSFVVAQSDATADPAQKTLTTQTAAAVPSADPKSAFTAGAAKMPTTDVKHFTKDSVTTPVVLAKQATSSESGWEVAFAPYLYLSGLKGTIGARGRTAEIDLSVGDVLRHFRVGLMGTIEAKKGRFVVVNDLMWIKLSKTFDTPGSLYSSVKDGANIFILDPEAGYRLYGSEKGSFDVVGGVRIMSVENNINFRTGILAGFDVSERKTWATPVFGARGLANLSPKFFVNGKFDVGGGLGADFTDQFYVGGGYRINPKIALVGGWRYMKTDYDDSSGFVFDTTMNGLVLGAKFSF